MGKSPRERRREKRVHAKYLVHTNQTQRRELSEEEIKTFFEEIYRKNFSFFGIVKCSQVNLDAIHDLPKLPRPMVSLLFPKEKKTASSRNGISGAHAFFFFWVVSSKIVSSPIKNMKNCA